MNFKIRLKLLVKILRPYDINHRLGSVAAYMEQVVSATNLYENHTFLNVDPLRKGDLLKKSNFFAWERMWGSDLVFFSWLICFRKSV